MTPPLTKTFKKKPTVCIVILCAATILSLNSCENEVSSTWQNTSIKQGRILQLSNVSNIELNALRAKIHTELVGNKKIHRQAAWVALMQGASSSDDYMTLFYSRRTVLKSQKASGENQSQPDYWNREHLWPRSYGLKGTPADFDLHNLVPVDRTINSSRGNKVFGIAHRRHHECLVCRVSSDVWEPPDEIKGDIARVLFYMDVRYEGKSVSEPYSEMSDLTLGETPDASETKFGPLRMLLRWHCDDHVSDDERLRQDVIFNFQGNRNIFVDSPELVEAVYAFDCISDVISTAID